LCHLDVVSRNLLCLGLLFGGELLRLGVLFGGELLRLGLHGGVHLGGRLGGGGLVPLLYLEGLGGLGVGHGDGEFPNAVALANARDVLEAAVNRHRAGHLQKRARRAQRLGVRG